MMQNLWRFCLLLRRLTPARVGSVAVGVAAPPHVLPNGPVTTVEGNTVFARPGEPPPAPHASVAFAAAGGIGTHAPGAKHTYVPHTTALTEGVLMADQLARSST
jgi:hypothetical protein